MEVETLADDVKKLNKLEQAATTVRIPTTIKKCQRYWSRVGRYRVTKRVRNYVKWGGLKFHLIADGDGKLTPALIVPTTGRVAIWFYEDAQGVVDGYMFDNLRLMPI